MDRSALSHSTGKFRVLRQISRFSPLVLLFATILCSCSFFENNKLRAVKSAGELTAYFADLRQKMEAAGPARTPLV